MSTLAFLGPIGWPEMVILGFLGLLIFGGRLPDVAKGLGQSIVSFKKGLKGVEDDIDKAASEPAPAPQQAQLEDHHQTQA